MSISSFFLRWPGCRWELLMADMGSFSGRSMRQDGCYNKRHASWSLHRVPPQMSRSSFLRISSWRWSTSSQRMQNTWNDFWNPDTWSGLVYRKGSRPNWFTQNRQQKILCSSHPVCLVGLWLVLSGCHSYRKRIGLYNHYCGLNRAWTSSKSFQSISVFLILTWWNSCWPQSWQMLVGQLKFGGLSKNDGVNCNSAKSLTKSTDTDC